jgi:pyochelin biosynthetic protein PchC
VFQPWTGSLPGFAALLACQLPGRESRIDETPVPSLAIAADAVAAAYLAKRPDARPLVLFGHSMGAVLAFEVARRLTVAGRAPASVLISASTPPGETSRTGGMDPEALKALLVAYDPQNAAIVSNDELFDALAPVLQGDIALLRNHRIAPAGPALDMPVWLFSGTDDRIVPQASVARWARHFTGPTIEVEVSGGHHFPFRESPDAILARLTQVLREVIRPGAGA